MAIRREDITGLVLAGGRGSRMGGLDKGLQLLHGLPLAQLALERLSGQVGCARINANRHLEAYRAFGVPVWPDADTDFPGPLAGMLAGLEHCQTPWLLTVPCDTPAFPLDLAERLAAAAAQQRADVALAATRGVGEALQLHPVFALLRCELRASLAAFMQSGRRKIDRWTAEQRQVLVPFDDDAAFFNANTADELAQLQDAAGTGRAAR